MDVSRVIQNNCMFFGLRIIRKNAQGSLRENPNIVVQRKRC